MLKMHPYASFDAAARAALKFLHDRLGFDLWMVTRTEGENWIVLQAEDHGYGVHDGAVFRWADSFCSQMVLGRGPCIAPSAMEVPAYATAPIGNVVDIGAYVGVPLTLEDGSLFGTLCAIDPDPQPEEIAENLTLIEMISRMLSTILHAELNAEAQSRLAEQARTLALTDGLTGLYNRRGWDQLTAAEECRCRRYGHSASVLSIDLDGLKEINDQQGHAAGDELIRRAATRDRGHQARSRHCRASEVMNSSFSPSNATRPERDPCVNAWFRHLPRPRSMPQWDWPIATRLKASGLPSNRPILRCTTTSAVDAIPVQFEHHWQRHTALASTSS